MCYMLRSLRQIYHEPLSVKIFVIRTHNCITDRTRSCTHTRKRGHDKIGGARIYCSMITLVGVDEVRRMCGTVIQIS